MSSDNDLIIQAEKAVKSLLYHTNAETVGNLIVRILEDHAGIESTPSVVTQQRLKPISGNDISFASPRTTRQVDQNVPTQTQDKLQKDQVEIHEKLQKEREKMPKEQDKVQKEQEKMHQHHEKPKKDQGKKKTVKTMTQQAALEEMLGMVRDSPVRKKFHDDLDQKSREAIPSKVRATTDKIPPPGKSPLKTDPRANAPKSPLKSPPKSPVKSSNKLERVKVNQKQPSPPPLPLL